MLHAPLVWGALLFSGCQLRALLWIAAGCGGRRRKVPAVLWVSAGAMTSAHAGAGRGSFHTITSRDFTVLFKNSKAERHEAQRLARWWLSGVLSAVPRPRNPRCAPRLPRQPWAWRQRARFAGLPGRWRHWSPSEERAGGPGKHIAPPPCNWGSIIAEVFSTDYYAWVKIPWMCNIFARISLFYNII